MGGLELATAWPSILAGGGLFGAPLSIVALWWAHKRATRKQTDDVSIEMVRELKALRVQDVQRISALEMQSESERRACAAEIEGVRQALRAAEAEWRLREGKLLHQLKNREQDLKGLFWVVEFAPSRAAELVERLKREREERESDHD